MLKDILKKLAILRLNKLYQWMRSQEKLLILRVSRSGSAIHFKTQISLLSSAVIWPPLKDIKLVKLHIDHLYLLGMSTDIPGYLE